VSEQRCLLLEHPQKMPWMEKMIHFLLRLQLINRLINFILDFIIFHAFYYIF